MTKSERQETKQSILFMCRLVFKSMAIVLTVGYVFIYAFLNVKSADAATLKSEATIHDKVVKVSDLFDDVATKYDAIIGNAPTPGQSVILNSKTLDRIANVYNIKWESSHPSDQIVVRSVVQTIGSDDMLAVIKKDLLARGVTGDFNVTLNNVAPTIILPGNVETTVEIAQMNYTAGRDVFTAILAAPSAANPVKTLSISGLIEKTMPIPVLSAAVTAGDIISSVDIEWMDVATRSLSKDTIIDADNLIGKTPTRIVDARVPVRVRDVKSPQLVARGDEILLQFNHAGLQLTAKGKAMQNGAEGEFIRVMNLSSNQSLRGEVTGSKTVSVQ